MTSAPRKEAPRTLAVLGSTGSIGVQTLDVASREHERLRVTALVAGCQRSACSHSRSS